MPSTMQLLLSTLLSLATTLPHTLARALPPVPPITIRLQSGPHSPNSLTDSYAYSASTTTNKLKSTLGRAAVAALVANETDAADTYWKSLLAASDPSKPSNAFARVAAVVDSKVLNVTVFQAWFQEFAPTGYPSRLLQSNPQHYLMDVSPTVRDTIEVMGAGPATRTLATPQTQKPYMKLLPEFSAQGSLELKLRDGTHFGDANSAFRDTEGGLEVQADLYLPEKTPREILEAECEHLSVEAGNWLRFAWEDVVGGKVEGVGGLVV